MKDRILFEMKCKECRRYFLYHRRQGQDFRCYDCRRKALDEVEKELAEMSEEEYQLFMDDIKEYQDELEKKRTERLDRKKDSQGD
jgi:hypothetical protein